MPNGDGDKVKVTMPDGQVWSIPKDKLAAAQARGAKPFQATPTAQPEGTGTKVARGAALGVFSGLGIPETQTPIKDLAKGLIPKSINDFDPVFGPLIKMIQAGKSMVVEPGKEVYKGIKQKDPEMIAHGGAQLTTEAALALLGKEKGAETGEAVTQSVSKGAKGAARELVGVGKGDISKAIEDSHAKVDAAHENFQKQLAEHSEKVDQATEKVAKKIGDVQQKKVEASAKQTAAETRKEFFQSPKSGPVYKRLTKMADTASENVQLVDKKIRALENAKWNEFKKGVGDAPIDWEPVQKSVLDAEQNILQGSPESIKIFQNILKEGEGPLSQASVFRGGGRLPGADLKDVMRSMDPKAQAKFLQNLQAQGVEAPADESGVATQGAKTDLDTARGFSTELGQKVYGRELPGDVRRALKSVQDSIEGEVTRTVAKSGGKAAVDTYRKLKSDWRNYMEAFYDKDSPVRKLKEGKDPNDKLNPVVGDEGERAIALLGKYRSLGADVGSLGKMRALFKAIKELPASGGKAPSGEIEAPKIPKAPEAPAGKPLTAEDARRAKLEKGAAGYAHPPSRWELMFPPLLAYKMMLKKALQNPKVQDWLAKDAPSQGAPLP